MIELINKLQRAGKLDVRTAGDGFALRVPQYDPHTGEALESEEQAIDLPALIARRDALQADLTTLNTLIALLTDMKGGRQ